MAASQCDSIQSLSHGEAGAFRLLANPVRVPGAEMPNRPAPELGANTGAILAELGYDAAARRKLRDAGIT